MQSLTSQLWAAGGSDLLQQRRERDRSAGLSRVFSQPLQRQVFSCSEHAEGTPLLPKAALPAAAAADVPGRAGQPSFRGSQEPQQPGNSGLMLSPGMVPSLADPSGPGHHDRCWEHMPGINALRHSHKRARCFLRRLLPPSLSEFYLANRKIGLFLPPLLPAPLHQAFSS